MEAYVSLGHSSLTDMHALEAMRLISSNLQKSIGKPNNLEYRHNMMLASLESGLAFSNASLGAAHAMAHSLGGLLDLPHGQCNAMLLDGEVDFNYGQAEQRYRDTATAMASKSVAFPPVKFASGSSLRFGGYGKRQASVTPCPDARSIGPKCMSSPRSR